MATGGEQGWRREGLHSERSDRREALAVIQVEGTESGSTHLNTLQTVPPLTDTPAEPSSG